MFRLIPWIVLCALSLGAVSAQRGRELRVAVSGAEPFVVADRGGRGGIAVEIWQMAAAQAGWRYQFVDFPNVSEAMSALRDGKVDAAIGPISITAERAEYARFSQPFFSSHIAILSRTESPTPWQRVKPFFSEPFFFAVAGLLTVLAMVGTLIWLAERRAHDTYFPQDALHGIGNGIWFAIVTMSTVGYGDMAPKTILGRIVTAIWIVISVIAATSLVAGIAGTIVVTNTSVEIVASAEQLRGRDVAALAQSPGEIFAARFGARVQGVDSLQAAYALLERRDVDAVVFDRPQLQYFLDQQKLENVTIAAGDYEQQNYGFAFPLKSNLQHDLNLNLLQLRESGAVDRIVERWSAQE